MRLVGCGPGSCAGAASHREPRDRTRLPDDQIGRWVSDIGRIGLLNQPEQTREIFAGKVSLDNQLSVTDWTICDPATSVPPRRRAFITVRIKDLIIVDGQNHHP